MILRNIYIYHSLTLLFVILSVNFAKADIDKIRVTWTEDPSSSLTILWNQVSGTQPFVIYDTQDHGNSENDYQNRFDQVTLNQAKSMNTYSAKLTNLQPGTVYYFMIGDSEGCSQRFSVRTIPNSPNERLSIIAGGDSRNLRTSRIKANKLVAKLRPDVVLFSGDMTGGNSASEWKQWLNDWQHTIASDGRITPLLVARGNHEFDNKSLVDLFALESEDVYYALNFGGQLLRIYTLNSLIAPGGDQATWLRGDLANNQDKIWRIAMYHYPIRPHTAKKAERNDQYKHWAGAFHKYQLQMAIECDAHLAKTTWPIRPSTESGSQEGFIRDDATGTVFVGEGGWGAPLRNNNDEKSWTRNSGSFNQFKWIFVDSDNIEIRTIKTDNAEEVGTLSDVNRFQSPKALDVWKPSNGAVVTIARDRSFLPPTHPEEELATRGGGDMQVSEFAAKHKGDAIQVVWKVKNEPCGLVYELLRSIDGSDFKPVADESARCNGGGTYMIKDTEVFSLPINQRTRINYRLVRNMNGERNILAGHKDDQSPNGEVAKLMPDGQNSIAFKYTLQNSGEVTIHLIDPNQYEVQRYTLGNKPPGTYLEKLSLNDLPSGNYILSIRNNDIAIGFYRVLLRS